MADTDANVPETSLETPATVDTPTTPSQDNGTVNADAEALKAQLQKLEMERNLLRKQKDALEANKREREQKELEEKEDYRSLAERAIAEAEALRKEKEENENKQAVQLATDTVYSGFDAKVVEIAKTAGLSAKDSSEEAQTELRSKLEAIQGKLGTTRSSVPSANNPNVATPPDFDKAKNLERMKWDNPTIRNQAIKSTIGNLNIVKAMKEQSGRTPQEI